MLLIPFLNAFILASNMENQFTVTSPMDTAYMAGVEGMWPSASDRRQIAPISKGDRQLTYFRFLKNDAQTDTIKTFTGVFYPKVDDYTQMAIPNSTTTFIRLYIDGYIVFVTKLRECQLGDVLCRTIFGITIQASVSESLWTDLLRPRAYDSRNFTTR